MNACNTFSEVDNLFINYETNEDEFNTDDGLYNRYCPIKNGYKRCETNYEKLSAISRHAYTELMQNDQVDIESKNDLNVDFLIMGLSNRLYKISKDHSLSLKDAFGKYLGNSIGSFNHQSILYNKKYYMGYNIGVMNGFYLLFKQICETIRISEKPNAQQYEYLNNVTQCHIMYDKLYDFVNQCDPYLQLLDHLKTIYNELIEAVIKVNGNDQILRSKLTKLSPIDKTKFEYEFNSAECKKLNKRLAKTTPNIIKLGIQMLKDDEKRKNGEGSQSTEGEDDEDLDIDLDEEDDDLDLDDEEDGDDLQNNDDTTKISSDQMQNTPQGTPPVPAQPVPTPSGASPSIPDNGADTTGSKANPQSDSSNHTPTSDNNQGGSGGIDGVICDKVGTGSGKDGKIGGTGSGSCGDQRPPNPVSVNQSSASENSGAGSKGSGDQGATNSSGTSNGYWSSNWGSLNLLNYLPSASKIYETQNRILTEASNKISSAYNSAVIVVKDAYDTTIATVKDTYNSAVTNLNYAYTTSTNYISGAVSSITNQLSSLGSFSQLGDDQSELGGPGNGSSTGDNPLKIPQTPKSDSDSPPLPPSPSVTLPPPQTSSPSQLQQTAPQKIQATNLQPHSGPTQDSSQITDQNGGSNPVQSHNTNPGTGISQTTNYSTDQSSTGSGITTETVVKIDEKSSIWCIASNKKCDVLSIGIICISIFAFLTIMYKYISFGSGKNSKTKKNMKRVINLADGNRKTQIIIKSYDRNKRLKPVINSVGRKKDSLLNICKLMQADPIPFINLFFLLIFFVYKKKFNYLEL
ncbi:PIR protein CIR protein [Plasmodium vinckei lentum]|uniref:PIR protein CIR protein n=1 Tax=Plasmodium vinckei lentum TaxID=138297 RepID=A0A6V7RZ96_PLAVN|nr:PIR protein CIR protein [Plasmodium vinckei lentum]